MISVFFDTWAYVALANPRDAGHDAAVEASEWIEATDGISVTSDYVLDETLTGLHARAGAGPTLAFLADLEAQVAGGQLILLSVDPARRRRALDWFRRLAKDTPKLSFTDCTSFALMDELKISAAFTPDGQFSKVKGVHRLIAQVKDRLVFRAPVG